MNGILFSLPAALYLQSATAGDPPQVDTAPSKMNPAERVLENQQIVTQTPGTDGVFVVQSDGTIKHIQSGLICPARLPNVDLYQVFVFAHDGSDVGCDYRRADDRGGAWSKLTIFATKARPDTTLDQAYVKYHNEIMRISPNARSQGPAIREQGEKNPGKGIPEIRSEEFVEPMNGTTYTSQLFVTIVSSWIIEVRTTFVGLSNNIEVGKDGGVEAAESQLGDRLMGPKELLDAAGTVGRL